MNKHDLVCMVSISCDYEERRLIFKNKIIQNRCFQMGVTLLKSPAGKPGFSLMQGESRGDRVTRPGFKSGLPRRLPSNHSLKLCDLGEMS